MCICGPESAAELLQHHEQIRVATKYPRIAKDYFYNKKHQTVEIIKLNGSIELAPIVGLSEVICDIVETGTTLRENGLTVLGEVCPLSARALIADAYAATVPGAAVRTHFQKLAVLGHTSVTTDIKMIPHRAETSRFVVTEQLLGGVIPGGACGAAMNDDIFHGSGGCHHRAVPQAAPVR